MVISNITLIKNAKNITLAADITFHGKKTEHAYITTDRRHEAYIASDASPFLAAVLIPCMKNGENIVIEGSVSETLLLNANAIMRLISKWNMGFHKITIKVSNTIKDTYNPQAKATFFTAGVDSFYTYLKHKKDKKPISHLLLAHGFDIPLSNTSFFKQVKNTVTKVAKQEKIDAIFITTNVGEIIEKRLVWDFAHGGALAAMALFLRKGIKTMYIPGAVRNDQLFPYGTHPELDKLWSTEKQQVMSDGGENDRLGKITTSISKSPLALAYLRVCTQNLKDKYNCSRCYKCLMTIIALAASDGLAQAKTFERTLNLEAIRNMYYDYKLAYNIQGEQVLALLKKRKIQPKLQQAIAFSLEKSKHPALVKKIAKVVAHFDQKYNDRRLYQYIFQMNSDNDRNSVFKFLLKKGVLK